MAQTADTISVHCACGKKLKAPATAAGRKAKCPACGNVLVIEAPPPPPGENDPLDALYDLAETEKSAAASNQVDDSPRCPKCGSATAPGAVLCVNCGYDFRTKRKVTAKSAPVAAEKSVAGRAAAPAAEEPAPAEGSFIMGLVFGVLFALGGAIVYGVAKYFLDDVPFIGMVTGWGVLAVGYLAGFGVDKGYKGGNAFAGITAASITLVVVLVTKFLVLAALVAPHVKKAMDNVASGRDDERVTQMVRDDYMKKAGISPHAASMADTVKFEEMADKRVKTMTKPEYDAYEKKADSYEAREELFEYVQEDVMKEKKIDPVKVTRPDEVMAAAEADRRIAAMSDAEVQTKLKSEGDQAAEEFKAKLADASKKHGGGSSDADSDSGSSKHGGGISGSVLGFGIILGLLLLVWFFLPTIIAMLLAYKVAANA
jgi:DNA-directed RNA polymerase subunit RPC12/RpoP